MPVGRFINIGSALPDIAAAIRESGSVALDLETYGPRKSDGLDPWAGDIRLLSLCVPDQEPWILDLRAIGYDSCELKSALEAVEGLPCSNRDYMRKAHLAYLSHSIALPKLQSFKSEKNN